MGLMSWFKERRGGVVPAKRSFTVETEMHRSEELRVIVRDAPGEDELNGGAHDPWRPARTLGKR